MKTCARRLMACAFIVALAGVGCGHRPDPVGGSVNGEGPTAALFRKAATTYAVPARLLLAVALNESNLSPRPVSATYLTSDNEVGIPMGETAFGLPRAKIGLRDEAASSELATQVDAYARWVRKNLDDKHLNLNPNPTTSEEKYDWIWQLALMHRDGIEARRNVQIIFAKETIKKLNQGAIWQDPASGEIVELTGEAQAINVDDFPAHIKKNLQLFTDDAQVFGAQYFELTYQQPEDTDNRPTHVRVIHCPLSLSACLELQNPTSDADALRLQAHYIIPSDKDTVSEPLQVARHSVSLMVTNSQGDAERVSDALVVMLVGDSGRYEGGKRTVANPKWVTSYQLQKMGAIIRRACPLLKKENPDINETRCMTPGVPDGVTFMNQGSSEAYQWGDIPDYDEGIFWNYIQTPDALSGEALFEFGNPQRIFDAAQPVRFGLKFIRGAAKIVLEQLERCQDGKLIWSTVQSHQVRNVDRKSFDLNIFAAGPNASGQHFFRALVYDGGGALMGWAVDDLYLKGFEESGLGADVKSCRRNGT